MSAWPTDPPDERDQVYLDCGYIFCRGHAEWHRPPECPVDERARPNPVGADD